jgi:hypothetical protein
VFTSTPRESKNVVKRNESRWRGWAVTLTVVGLTGCQSPPYKTRILNSQPAPMGMPSPALNSSRTRPILVPEAPVAPRGEAVTMVPGPAVGVPVVPAVPGEPYPGQGAVAVPGAAPPLPTAIPVPPPVGAGS